MANWDNTKFIMTKWQADKKANWQYGKSVKCHIDKMEKQKNMQVDKLAICQQTNIQYHICKLPNCQVDKPSSRQRGKLASWVNVHLTKRQANEMTKHLCFKLMCWNFIEVFFDRRSNYECFRTLTFQESKVEKDKTTEKQIAQNLFLFHASN